MLKEMENDLHIAMISYHTNPFAALGGKQTGGMNVYIRELSKSLAALGHTIDIFTRASENLSEILEIEKGIRLIPIEAGPSETQNNVQLIEHISTFGQGILAYAQKESLSYDIAHAHYWMSGIAAISLKKAWSIPCIMMMHTLGLMKERVNALSEEEANQRIRGERLAIANADKIISSTPAEEFELQWLYEVKSPNIEVISPGVDHTLFRKMDRLAAREKHALRKEENILLFVGRIDVLKGLDTLLRAIQIIMQDSEAKFLDPKLLVVGGALIKSGQNDEAELDRMIERSKELSIKDQITFTGQKKQVELPEYYNLADIVILPSHYESFGLVALEAMACGQALIASRVGGLVHLVEEGQTGILSPAGDAQSLSDNIIDLLNDEKKRTRLGKNAQSFAKKYSWEKNANRTQEIYFELIKGEQQEVS